ncbi:MAG: hypothetical protein IJK38_06850 [Oscillospiraceae bacterium]|nr:hypothetical protein [Oscillospiraceae bacterium]
MMGTENKSNQNPMAESTEMTPTVTVSMKKLVAGVGTMFAGVLQMLEALEPQAAKQLIDRVVQDAETDQAAANDTVSAKEETEPVHETEATAKQADVEEQAAPVEEVQDPTPAADQTQTVTVDDITKIIVRKVKQDRTNNEKIGSILKTYGVARVSELPTAKYEAFLTDISQL